MNWKEANWIKGGGRLKEVTNAAGKITNIIPEVFGEMPPIRTKILVKTFQKKTGLWSVWCTHFESDLIRSHVLIKWNITEWALLEPLQELDTIGYKNFDKSHTCLKPH